jgi:hypothetical protein
MALTGKAKTDYQREYMRKYRSNNNKPTVRPEPLQTVRPKLPAPLITDFTKHTFTGELTKVRQTSDKGFNG